MVSLSSSASASVSVGVSVAQSSGELAKARLIVTSTNKDGNGLKAGGPTGKIIEFTFNPNQLSFTRTMIWHVKTQEQAGPSAAYGSTEPTSMSVEMFLDASEGGTVTSQVDAVLKLTEVPDGSTPDIVRLMWGSTSYLLAMVKSVAVSYTRFSRSGEPIRATLTLSLQEFISGPQGTNPTSGGLQAVRSHTVSVGDSLAGIARTELNSPSQWRALAAFNGIDDPLRVRPGTTVLIPTRPDERVQARR